MGRVLLAIRLMDKFGG